jgi:hypothetical protein
VGTDLGINTLIGSADQCVAFLNISIDSTVTPSPIGMLAKHADAPWNENFHKHTPDDKIPNNGLLFASGKPRST